MRFLAFLALAGLLVLLVSCSTADPQNTFSPSGEVADRQRDLFNLVLWPAVAILVIVEGLLVIALMRFRQRQGQQQLPRQVHGNTRLEIAWTAAPAILLLVLAIPTVASIVDLGRTPAADALKVRVIGQQWVWQFQYPDITDAQGKPLTIIGTPDKPAELHIPAGREIDATVETVDVIHSFWVPKLGGKLDAIPGRSNRFWFNATAAGSYSGQCAEFCGLGHANMRFIVVAHESEAEFQQWVDDQMEEAARATGTDELEVAAFGE